MSVLAAVILVFEGLVFAAWAFVAFRTLFDVTGRARRLSGKMFPGPGWAVHAWANWWRDRSTHRHRLQFIGLTIALFVLIIAFVLVRNS
jgi:hypothetical protein